MAYLAPIHRPSSIRHAIRISFLTPDSEDLIVAKGNRIEIWSPNNNAPDQLICQHSKSLYGKVTILHKIRPATSHTDHLFIGTDRYHYFTVSWDPEQKQLRTEKSYVDIAEKAARDSQTGDRAHIDPTNRFMTLECYEGVVNVLPIAHAGKGKRKAAENEIGELGDPVPVRIPELFVKSSAFLHKRSPGSRLPNPELAILYEDSNSRPRIKVRELEFTPSLRPQEEPSQAELGHPKDVTGNIELGATFLIPLPPPMYGMLVVGDTCISYVDEWNYRVQNTQPLEEATVFVAWCQIDEQRFTLADDYGKLYLLFIQQNNRGEYVDHQLDLLGETSRASTLVYLDAGRIFVSSHQGDSQIIQVSERSLEVIQAFPNIAPILDFTIMDMGNRSSDATVNEFSSGQARIVTGSGAFKDGSLRSVRSGVGLEDLGSIGDMGTPVSGVFSVRSSAASTMVDTLLVSFVNHTRAFRFSSDGDIEEVDEFKGLNLGESTLHAGSLPDGRAFQVTSSSVVLVDSDGSLVLDAWQSSSGASITAASSDQSTILLSLGGAVVVVLDVASASIIEKARREFPDNEQVSCICISSLMAGSCFAGFWKDSKVSLLSLSDLSDLATEVVDPDSLAVPRSLLVANILQHQPPTLFVGLADGNVITYTIASEQKLFTGRKSMVLGTQQPNFSALPRGDGLENVFATCEHPSLIYGSEGRMVYSAITAEDAQCICPFDSEAYPGAIAIVTAPDIEGSGSEGGELKLALVDEQRTTHVQTLPIRETVRRIAYSAELKTFGLGCIQRTLSDGTEEIKSCFKLVDEVAFSPLHSYDLNNDELIESVLRCQLDDGSGDLAERFVVGTAYLDDSSPETARGRILIFEVTEERKLKLITELAVRGAVRCLGMCKGKIVAALLKTVIVYSFEYETSSQPFLVKEAVFRTATAPIDLAVTNDVIAVTDLMKSVSMVKYTRGRGGSNSTLAEIARHFETVWGTAVANVAENTYLESDAEGNLIVLQHEINGFSEADRRRMRVTSEMLLGEMVNRIRRIDVQPSPGAIVIPRAFLATVEGSIYVFALIAPGKQDLLMRMQTLMADVVQSPGHVPFNKFRGFKSSIRDLGEEGPQRFVDGELIERYLDASAEVQEKIAVDLGIESETLRGMVENLRRIH
ncbi:hypothetical protein K431DRAFT_284744 [Polychaeton citri CBS 116435]|uniref:DNA damage-binding protein 1 n=1 Tax=Polychaeton citri CBS 116435 TaxID=1314669 RepID=A0A9P4QB63_9PEZI|nr:hypothetical protein K431DRAFT_284744 [Polychaeton citri CBS 116435]